ncbi:MAG: phosphatidylserine decarboxylase, partial [Lentisphaeria bacterium]|nr:phosphatidylserine decarboxylase [Lentisphaeria bacterium]
RLAPVDYHRYHFPCDCVQESPSLVIPGKYHSVNPVALAERPDIYAENTRQITLLSSPVFGRFLFLEVGAFGVGSIVSTSGPGAHGKMEEKGYFKFGGSTVILIFEAEKISWEEDLLKNTGEELETLVRCGSTLARGK